MHKYALHLQKIINIVSILFLFGYQMVVVRNFFLSQVGSRRPIQ
ncbi:unnamed protein product, partial [Brassica rapa subsp. trilocularis]